MDDRLFAWAASLGERSHQLKLSVGDKVRVARGWRRRGLVGVVERTGRSQGLPCVDVRFKHGVWVDAFNGWFEKVTE